MEEKLKQAINSLIDISEIDCDRLISLFEFKILKNKENFKNSNSDGDFIIFIETGVLKKSVLNKNGGEYINCFHESNQFFLCWAKKKSQQLENIRIQSVGIAKIHIISKNILKQLSKEIKGIYEFIRKISEKFAMLMEKRICNLMETSADSRLLLFKLNHPNLINIVTKQQLASFLGISPQHFSRLIKKEPL